MLIFLYGPTLTSIHDIGKTIALTRWTFVGKVIPLRFNTLSRLVIVFLPKSKSLLISWLQSPSALTLEPPEIKSLTVSTVSPSICHEVSEEAVPGPSVFPSGEPGVSGDFWGSQEGCQGPSRPSGSLLFNMLSRLLMAFLPRSMHLLIS